MSAFSDNRRFRKLSLAEPPLIPKPARDLSTSSWPGSSRPPTPSASQDCKDVGALDKGGHEGWGGGAVSILTHPWVYSDGLIGSRGLG
jgi:hypothetical protein